MVKDEIRRYALREYLKHCILLHKIAFMQWRLLFSTPKSNIEQIKGLIEDYIAHLYQNRRKKGLGMKKYELQSTTFLPEVLGIDPHKHKSTKCKEAYLIHSFNQINMQDPFPSENKDITFTKPQSINSLVYKQNRYKEGASPQCVYLPSRAVLFSIMRACIKMTNTDELWF